jgi:glutathione reductase (NADPH)
LKARRDAEVARLEGVYRSNLVSAGVQIFVGRARLTGPNAITVASAGWFDAEFVGHSHFDSYWRNSYGG